jgi:hypothetical protein
VLNRWQKIVLVGAGLVLLFVVLCPATPTPTAVVKHQNLAALFFVSAILLFFKTPEYLRVSPGTAAFVPHSSGSEVIDLTCSRLC